MRDVLADVLDLLHLQSVVYCQATIAKPDWALAFQPARRAVFHIVSQGVCTLRLADQSGCIDLNPGDLLLVTDGGDHVIQRGSGHPLCATIALETAEPVCTLMHYGADAVETTLVCGTFTFSGPNARSLLALLPPVLHFPAAQAQKLAFAPLLTALMDEAQMQRPGAQTILTRLADVLFVQIMRAWLDDPVASNSGWLRALRDPHIARSLGSLHAAPERDWTVAHLAQEALMSRSAFAARFQALVGEPPLRYLTNWRMQLACRLLQNSQHSLAAIAAQVGYESEAAFSKAFKRAQGCSPGQYRRQSLSVPAGR